MSETIEFKHNQKSGLKRRQFKKKFPDKKMVESRITTIIDSAVNLEQLKRAIKKVLIGSNATPGLVDALFQLDR